MKISTILDYIDSGYMALPEFQRGYVWNRDQVKSLFDSLYRRHPVGELLVWATMSNEAIFRGEGQLPTGIVKLLLDGQQRMTSIYGVVRGRAPKFFDGNKEAFTGLYFHLENEVFSFYQPMKMQDDSLWINVTSLMLKGTNGLGDLVATLSAKPEYAPKIGYYAGRLSRLLSITDIDLHIEEVTGEDKTIDVVVDIFNRVNSGGTKLSKGDLALAKICAEWPDARETMKKKLNEWSRHEYYFNLDWLLRSVNTILTGEAKFQYLHNKNAEEIKTALSKATKLIDKSLNYIAGRLGLDHDQVLFGRYAIPVMVHYMNRLNGEMNDRERDKLLFWFVQSGMWGRFSGSTESFIDKDLAALEDKANGLDMLLEQLRLWHNGLRVEAGHFTGWSLGARFYPVLYMLTRMGEAKDWGTGLPLKSSLLGRMSKLEVHHIFPKAQLYKHKAGYTRSEVNALANFTFQTKETNLWISDKLPEKYFPIIEKKHPGTLASHWIPQEPYLWKIENYREFLEARKILLAEETNRRMMELLHGENHWFEGTMPVRTSITINGGITSEEEENTLIDLNLWIENIGLPPGRISYDHSGDDGQQLAIFDLAWPTGIQEELSQPVAVLLNESQETLAIASKSGFRCFTSVSDFKNYVLTEIMGENQFTSEGLFQSASN